MGLADRLKQSGVTGPALRRREPLWTGPCGVGPNGGVTQGLLAKFLSCRERCRLAAIEGLVTAEDFNHRIQYGSMWHKCEEELATRGSEGVFWDSPTDRDGFFLPLTQYTKQLCTSYPLKQEEIVHWYEVCRTQFPIYVDYWSKHPDVVERTPLLQEYAFDVLYQLPSERIVRLRGRWDSVDLIGKGKSAGVYLQENKTKGDIKEEQLKRQLIFDLQTCLYLIALRTEQWRLDDSTVKAKLSMRAGKERVFYPIRGVRYNVIRRPLSGGKGSIVRHKPTKSNSTGETKGEFYARLGKVIEEDPGQFFMRWKVEVTRGDLDRFERECLVPVLEQICDWYDWVVVHSAELGDGPFSAASSLHWRTPYFFNPLAEGFATDLDEHLSSGSEVGLRRTDILFPELIDDG